ncbi:MAG: TetR/AcrR family transcriptional regulator [Chloroflexota bacterium]
MIKKREQILQATCNLIFEQGLQSVSMSQIAKQAGVGMGTIYNYFESKEQLVNALYGGLKAEMSQVILQGYAIDQPIIERFIQLFSNIARYGRDNPKAFQLVEQLTHSPYIQFSLKESESGLLRHLKQLFAEAAEQRMLKPLPFSIVGTLTYGASAALVRGHIAGKFVLDDELIKVAAEACWDMVKR